MLFVARRCASLDPSKDVGLLSLRRKRAAGTQFVPSGPVEGFEAAIDRAQRYVEAGADMTFVEAPATLAQLEQVPKRLAVPQLLNMVLGGKTPIINQGPAA